MKWQKYWKFKFNFLSTISIISFILIYYLIIYIARQIYCCCYCQLFTTYCILYLSYLSWLQLLFRCGRISNWHNGHVADLASQSSEHWLWKEWKQDKNITSESTSISYKHIVHFPDLQLCLERGNKFNSYSVSPATVYPKE